MIGSRFDDAIYGNSEINSLFGSDGDDRLVGQGSGDHLDGGSGSDTASYHVYTLEAVTAFLFDPSRNLGKAEGDTYVSIENLEGSYGADTLGGDRKANRLSGVNGDDV
ncbi:hypothetical protein A6302_02120 [Methylobrevis pamukkalensis]|uniref:Uncharacterized protein n=1 Tax=Methylobrevis pamukkalensis TaxID=1439726 RepID=A0A1E3H2N6_9HYPH|nr:hypothetical protein A6302_02120 [Methylobrevis pamukkalensis]